MITKARKEKKLKTIKIPKCWYAECDPGILVMENLKDKGFGLINDSKQGFAKDEMKAFLEALGEFHASTYYLISTYPGGKDNFLAEHPTMKEMKSLGPEMEKSFKDGIDVMVEAVSDMCKTYVSEDLAKKVMQVKPYAFHNFNDAWLKTYGNFTTIIHGDSWANNAMFK